MFGQFTEQMKKSAQPANGLFAANAKMLEQMSVQQTQFFSGVISDSVKLMDTVSTQADMKEVLAAQSIFMQSFRDRMTGVIKSSLESASSISQQTAKSVVDSTASAQQAVKTTVKDSKPVSAGNKPVSKKSAAKPAEKSKKAIASARAPKPTTAVTVEKKAVTTPAKTVNKTIAKPAAKALAKPVAELSADEVKATAKSTIVKAETASTETK